MTKSSKPETPIYNWMLINRQTHGVTHELFDTRREAQVRRSTYTAPERWRVARVQIREVKPGRKVTDDREPALPQNIKFHAATADTRAWYTAVNRGSDRATTTFNTTFASNWTASDFELVAAHMRWYAEQLLRGCAK